MEDCHTWAPLLETFNSGGGGTQASLQYFTSIVGHVQPWWEPLVSYSLIMNKILSFQDVQILSEAAGTEFGSLDLVAQYFILFFILQCRPE